MVDAEKTIENGRAKSPDELESLDPKYSKIDAKLSRIEIWQDALKFYDQRRLQVMHYTLALIAGLIFLPKTILGSYELTADQEFFIISSTIILSIIVSIFSVGATYIYTDSCYKISEDIRNFEKEYLPGGFSSQETGRHGMGGSPLSSVYVLFAILVVLACTVILLLLFESPNLV